MNKDCKRFVFRISCDPEINQTESNCISFVDKVVSTKAEKIEESIISQLKDIMKEKGITELYAIDISKVMQLVNEHKALNIIAKTHLNVGAFMTLCKGDREHTPNTTYEQYLSFCGNQDLIAGDKLHSFPCYKMTKGEYELVLGVLYEINKENQ